MAAIFVLALLSGQARADLLCQADLPWIGNQRVAWFNLIADDKYQFSSANVFLRLSPSDAKWSVDERGAIASPAPDYFRYDLPVPSNMTLPVTVSTLINGAIVHSREAREIVQDATLSPDQTVRNFDAIVIAKDDVPGLFAARSLEFRVSDAAGRQLTAKTVPLPDWDSFSAQTRSAANEAEAKRKRHDCGPTAIF